MVEWSFSLGTLGLRRKKTNETKRESCIGNRRQSGARGATSRAFASEGAAIAINYRKSKEEAEKVADEIRSAGGEAIAVQADIRDQEGCTKHGTQNRANTGSHKSLGQQCIIQLSV